MFRQYLKQVVTNFKAQKMLCIVQVVGTALAIFVIMLYVVMNQINTASFVPESNRSRFLHIKQSSCESTDSTNMFRSDGWFSVKVARGCFHDLTTPEAFTIYSINDYQNISIPHGLNINAWVKDVDDGFWRVFDFSFVEGRPFTYAESESGLMVVILSKSIARQFFGSDEVVGKDILINKNPYRIVGVVEDVTPLAGSSFAQVWVPYMSTVAIELTFMNGYAGGHMQCAMLARSQDDFETIRDECEKLVLRFNELNSASRIKVNLNGQPYDQETVTIPSQYWDNKKPNTDRYSLIRLLIISILLLVPTINLSSMTHSRFRQRITEIGVRRAFGATHRSILWQVIVDNMILTFFAGIVGLLFCFLFAIYGADFLFERIMLGTIHVDIWMLMEASTFVLALLFCMILNLLSSFMPAWMASRANIISALNQK